MSTSGKIIRGEGEGERLWFAGGGVFTMKVTAEETDGAFVLLEDRMMRGKTTPLHTHPNLDETLIVLEGEILVYTEGREHRVGPRGVVVAPREVPHAFMVTSESAVILALQTPGSGEAFYRDASEPGTQASQLLPKPTRRGPTGIACGQLRSATPTSYRYWVRPRSRRRRRALPREPTPRARSHWSAAH
jgi:quercetin dioxygenase-like cupin family protein